MKKLNKKGITLAELIVSFILVVIASIYFFQTVNTVYDLYVKVTTKTDEYVDKNYAIRIAEAYIKTNSYFSNEDLTSYGASGYLLSLEGQYGVTKIYRYSLAKNGKSTTLYFYIP